MISRRELFPHVLEMNYQARRRLGCCVYLIFDKTEWALIDIGFEDTVDEIVDSWKETGRDATHGSKQQYVRKHWFHVRTTSGHEMKLYFERQARSKAQRKTRWWLYTMVESDGAADMA